MEREREEVAKGRMVGSEVDQQICREFETSHGLL